MGSSCFFFNISLFLFFLSSHVSFMSCHHQQCRMPGTQMVVTNLSIAPNQTNQTNQPADFSLSLPSFLRQSAPLGRKQHFFFFFVVIVSINKYKHKNMQQKKAARCRSFPHLHDMTRLWLVHASLAAEEEKRGGGEAGSRAQTGTDRRELSRACPRGCIHCLSLCNHAVCSALPEIMRGFEATW
ncbi:hypothetical protein F4778DRAFT_752482 [Xylariomycetidae sp. FL2044]|nr:hypothetical protein F4778DRAFT_752482 [Xylariomycetidae sp. FL2044]